MQGNASTLGLSGVAGSTLANDIKTNLSRRYVVEELSNNKQDHLTCYAATSLSHNEVNQKMLHKIRLNGPSRMIRMDQPDSEGKAKQHIEWWQQRLC